MFIWISCLFKMLIMYISACTILRCKSYWASSLIPIILSFSGSDEEPEESVGAGQEWWAPAIWGVDSLGIVIWVVDVIVKHFYLNNGPFDWLDWCKVVTSELKWNKEYFGWQYYGLKCVVMFNCDSALLNYDTSICIVHASRYLFRC